MNPAVFGIQIKFSEKTGKTLIPDWVPVRNIGLKKESAGEMTGELVFGYQSERVSFANLNVDQFGLFLARATHVVYQVKVPKRGVVTKHRLDFEWELEYVQTENLELVRDLFNWFATTAVYGVRAYRNPGNIWRILADNRRTPKDDGNKLLPSFTLELVGDQFQMIPSIG